MDLKAEVWEQLDKLEEGQFERGVRTYSWTLKGVKYICTQKNKKSMH